MASSNDVWKKTTDANGNEVMVLISSTPTFATLLDAQKAREALIRQKYKGIIESIVSDYTLVERETWFTQVKEAEAYIANPTTAVVPFITALATSRGVTISVVANKIITNRDSYNQSISQYLGQQQAKVDQVYTALTIDAVESVVF